MEDKSLSKDKFSYSYVDYSFLEEENKILKITVNRLKEEIRRLKEPPLMLCEVRDVINNSKAIITIPNGNKFVVNISLDLVNKIKPGDFVLCEQKNLNIVEKLDRKISELNVNQFIIVERPEVSYNDIGGLDAQIEEIKEVVELPLKNPELFKKVGITPPKGILLYGPPGTGKTLLAKAVAKECNATFIELVGSELVQKFIGEGAKLVRELFQLAREKAPSIIFIDELDAIAARRIEVGTSGEREVQRTFMQLLAEIDGFKNLDNVKIIGSTNRKDILDPAILRPGRLDRLIYVPLPDLNARVEILKIHTRHMKLDKSVNLKRIAELTEGFSGAEIKAVCTEAGYFAIRNRRYKVKFDDFKLAIKKVKQYEEVESSYLNMFG